MKTPGDKRIRASLTKHTHDTKYLDTLPTRRGRSPTVSTGSDVQRSTRTTPRRQGTVTAHNPTRRGFSRLSAQLPPSYFTSAHSTGKNERLFGNTTPVTSRVCRTPQARIEEWSRADTKLTTITVTRSLGRQINRSRPTSNLNSCTRRSFGTAKGDLSATRILSTNHASYFLARPSVIHDHNNDCEPPGTESRV